MSFPEPPRAPSGARRAIVLLLATVATFAPFATAHGTPAPYAPLVVEMHTFLASDGALVLSPPAPGAVALPAATPAAPPPELRFAVPAPVAFTAAAAYQVSLTLRADQLVVARDAEGMSLELQALPDGAPVRVALEPVLAPGAVATVLVDVPAPPRAFAEGDEVALAIRALMPGLQAGALSIVTGGDTASRADLRDLRVPGVSALRLQDVPHTEYLVGVDRFEPPADHAANVFRLGHGVLETPATLRFEANKTYVVLEGVEDEEDARDHAQADRAARVAAAHEFAVNGVLARVQPGVAVVVRAPVAPVVVQCVRNCVPASVSFPSLAATPSERPSALVPPPRDTTGIPVSEDEPEEKATPAPALLAALVLAAALRRSGHKRDGG